MKQLSILSKNPSGSSMIIHPFKKSNCIQLVADWRSRHGSRRHNCVVLRSAGGINEKSPLKNPEPTFLPPRHCWSWGLVRTPYWQWWGCQVTSLQSQVLLSEQLRQGTIHWPETDSKTSLPQFLWVKLQFARKSRIQWWMAHHYRNHSEETTLV